MSKKKKVVMTVSIVTGSLLVIAGITGYLVYYFLVPKMDFYDTKMADILAYEAGVPSYRMLTEKDLDKIKTLNIGYTGYYDTLKDIEKCKNLYRLIIGDHFYTLHNYAYPLREAPEAADEEKQKQNEEELREILQECPNLTSIYYSNGYGTEDFKDFSFLYDGNRIDNLCLECITDVTGIEKCEYLEGLDLRGCQLRDYSFLKDMQSVKYMSLEASNIASAEYILEMNNLETIYLLNTPLSRNQEEMQKLTDAFPDTYISYPH